MKKLTLIILILLFTSLTFGQSGKSVLSQAQKDSIGAMIRDSASFINVKSYGLSLDGSVDNTTSLNNLITASDDSSTFYFPEGTYKISSTVNIAKTVFFVGDGKDKTILNLDASGQINVQDNFYLSGFTVTGNTTSVAITARCTTWVKNVLDFIEISGNKFYGIAQPFSTGNVYDEERFVKNWRFDGNIVDSCFGGFEANTKYTNLYVTNNVFTNMMDRAATFSCVYAGAATSTLYDGETIISNNIIDSVNCTDGAFGHYGFIIYADNVIVSNNIIRNFSSPHTGVSNFNVALYISGSNFIVSNNIFYNASETHTINNGQTIFVKGNADLDKDRIIANNIFYSDGDSSGYAINVRSPAKISHNNFIYKGNYVYINGIIRPEVTSGTTPEYELDDRSVVIESNAVEANTNFITLFAPSLNNLLISNNYASLGAYNLYYTGYIPSIVRCIISGNTVKGKLGTFGLSNISQLDITNNNVLSQSGIIDINIPTNTNIERNIFVIDTAGTLNNEVIDIYVATPDKLTVTNIKDNTIRVMNTYTNARRLIYFTGGKYFIEDNTFIVDSVASGTMTYLTGIYAIDSTEYCKINNNKFITFGSEGFVRGIEIKDGVHNRVEVTENYFDDNITTGVYSNAGTISNLSLSGNDWHGTTFYANNLATVTLISKRQNWGDGIYNLSEYADADSLYRVIYDFTNSVQDTIGVPR